MRTKIDAARALLDVGWTPTEVRSILGNVSDLDGANDPRPATPWWTWVGEEWYTSGSSVEADWEAWVVKDKP